MNRSCDVCGQFPDDCICPECTVCHMVGDPGCYDGQGLVRSFGQAALHAEAERQWRLDTYAEQYAKGRGL